MVDDKQDPMRTQIPVFKIAATIPPLDSIHEIKTAAQNLDFSHSEEECNKYVQLNEQNENTRKEYLADVYLATYIIESGPIIISQCEVGLPPQETPFLVVDCVAIWLQQADPLPNDLAFYGEFSMGKALQAAPANTSSIDIL